MSSDPQPPIVGVLNQLWMKFLPQMEERVDVLRKAVRALSAGNLDAAQKDAAASAAHKLAGVLGTFGLSEGTNLAREAEVLYSGDMPSCTAGLPTLEVITEQLAATIHSRK